MKTGLLYVLESPSGKKYVGITTMSFASRWRQHRSVAKTRKTRQAICAAIRKYGPGQIKETVLVRDVPYEELLKLEQNMITSLNTLAPNGYNLTTGGECTRHSEESRRKMSASQKGRKHSAETRAKISASNTGHRHSAKTKQKIAAKAQGRRPSEATRNKMSSSRLRYLCSVQRDGGI